MLYLQYKSRNEIMLRQLNYQSPRRQGGGVDIPVDELEDQITKLRREMPAGTIKLAWVPSRDITRSSGSHGDFRQKPPLNRPDSYEIVGDLSELDLLRELLARLKKVE